MANYSYSLDIGKDLEKDLDKKPLKEVVKQPETIKNKSKTNIFSYLFNYKTMFLIIIILIIGFFVFNNKNSNEIIAEKNLNKDNIIIKEIPNKINTELQQDNLLKQVLIDGLKDDR